MASLEAEIVMLNPDVASLPAMTSGYWDRAQIALRPVWVNKERTEMQVAFHWLPLKEDMPGTEKHHRGDTVPIMENPYADVAAMSLYGSV